MLPAPLASSPTSRWAQVGAPALHGLRPCLQTFCVGPQHTWGLAMQGAACLRQQRGTEAMRQAAISPLDWPVTMGGMFAAPHVCVSLLFSTPCLSTLHPFLLEPRLLHPSSSHLCTRPEEAGLPCQLHRLSQPCLRFPVGLVREEQKSPNGQLLLEHMPCSHPAEQGWQPDLSRVRPPLVLGHPDLTQDSICSRGAHQDQCCQSWTHGHCK